MTWPDVASLGVLGVVCVAIIWRRPAQWIPSLVVFVVAFWLVTVR